MVVAAAVPEREVQHLALADVVQVEHRARRVATPLRVGEARGVSGEAGLEQDAQVAGDLRELELVVGLEGLDPAHEGMARLGDGDAVGRDRGVREEAAAEGAHPGLVRVRQETRRSPTSRIAFVPCSASQRPPPATKARRASSSAALGRTPQV